MSLLTKIAKKIVKKIYYPKDIVKSRVIFESNGPYDNSYTMFLYAAKNRPDIESYFYCPDFIIKGSNLNKKTKKFSFKGKRKAGRFLASHRLNGLVFGAEIIFSSYYLINPINKKTKYIYLCHGHGIKGTKNYFDGVLKSGCDILIPSQELFNIYSNYYHFCNNNVFICGAPRTDEIVYQEESKKKFDQMISRKQNELVVLCMITFRRNEDGSFNPTKAFPSFVELKKLDEILVELGIRFIIKLHHVLDGFDLSTIDSYKNIVFLKNVTIFENGFNTSSFIPYADAYITDYSSAASDFMLMDKPIAFITNDLNTFSGINQGFIVDNPLDYMPGNHINTQDDLVSFLKDIKNGADDYKLDRERISLIFNGFVKVTRDCSKKVLNHYYPENKKTKL